jgi:hypothetical protein
MNGLRARQHVADGLGVPAATGRRADAGVAQRELRGRYCLHGQSMRQFRDLIRRIVARIACRPMSHTG